MIQVVVDTNVVVSALRSRRGAAFSFFNTVGKDRRYQINVSVPLVLEYEEVLKRPGLCPAITANDVDGLIDWLCLVARQHEIHFLWRPVLKDARDEMLLELAVRAQAFRIITYNVRDFEGAAKFGVRAVTPREFLAELEERG